VLLLGVETSGAETLSGRVVHVSDGDSLKLRTAERTVRVRLAGIDTPERTQPWSNRARKALVARVDGKRVRVDQVDVDQYGRIVGEVFIDGASVNRELVRDGHAWVYRGLAKDPVLYDLEREARAARRGLWSLGESERQPPWEWRRENPRDGRGTRERKQARGRPPPPPPVLFRHFRCGPEGRCREVRAGR